MGSNPIRATQSAPGTARLPGGLTFFRTSIILVLMLYMIYWSASNGEAGGHVLVRIDDGRFLAKAQAHAMELGMRKAKAIHHDAEFLKLEELSDSEPILWVNEWYKN